MSPAELPSNALATAHPEHEALAQAFRAAGALSPATARALHEIAGSCGLAMVGLPLAAWFLSR